jgi:[Skp1-protein]-hydroxyproline N-acetylglucosaminyltransferase
LYARAEFPDRIRVAILDQRVNGDPLCSQPAKPCSEDPYQALCQYKHLIDVYEMDAVLAVGPVFARHLAHRHYRGEYFAMQIDSHVRFVEHWDSDIVGQWKSAKNEMAVLSTYLSDIIGSIEPETHKGIHKGRPIMCQSDYEGNGDNKHLRHGQQPEGEAGIKGQPTLHPFWAAGFSFARGHFVIQVPYDQHLPMVFQGEEISIGLRGFTYGYDYYAAERSTCFHMYAIKENEAKRKKVPLFWEHSDIYAGSGLRAMKRLNTIIKMGNYPPTEWVQDDIHKYGLGKIRNVEKFFKVFGIYTDEQRVEHHLCSFVGKPMMGVFLPALRQNRMGLDYDKINYVFVDPTPDKKDVVHRKKK